MGLVTLEVLKNYRNITPSQPLASYLNTGLPTKDETVKTAWNSLNIWKPGIFMKISGNCRTKQHIMNHVEMKHSQETLIHFYTFFWSVILKVFEKNSKKVYLK